MSGKKSVGRRDFIKSTISGVTGFFLATCVGAEQIEMDAEPQPSKKTFIRRTVGNTGIELPIISMGVMNSDNPNLVRAALDAGIVYLDTAWWYQNGRNEEMIGEVLQGRPRDSFVIATKVPGSVPLPYADGVFPDDEASRETLASSFLNRFDTSLKRLKLDYVDILYLHNVWTREAALFESLLEALAKVKKEGKARFVGLSTHRNEPEVIQAAIDSDLYDVVLTAYNFKQDHRLEVRETIDQAAQAGIGVVAMKTMAGGYWDKGKTKPVNAKAALKWALQNENVHTAIPGFTTFDQLEVALSVMEDLTLDESEKEDLQLESSIEESSIEGFYCQACGKCLSKCQQRLPIPEIMRAYMYAHGYGNFGEARNLLSSLHLPAGPCGNCASCSVSCAKGFDVADRIKDVLRLRKTPSDLIA
jgi:predicted aldo/keto reductase-like oxidoreductase